MKPQIIVIEGGSVFDSYEEYVSYLSSCKLKKESFTKCTWKKSLPEKLPEYEVLTPEMPCKLNAKYPEWKLWFEKILEISNQELILIGSSLGAIFLIKFLSENNITREIVQLHLVAPPYDAEGSDHSLGDFNLEKPVSTLSDIVKKIHFYFSTDDPVVLFKNCDKYKQELQNAQYHIFTDRGHFRQEDFPELLEIIKDHNL